MNELLQEALSAFGLHDAEFIQQHENAVYRADGRYLLRIHKAAEGCMSITTRRYAGRSWPC